MAKEKIAKGEAATETSEIRHYERPGPVASVG
jgi:hypothetical protein